MPFLIKAVHSLRFLSFVDFIFKANHEIKQSIKVIPTQIQLQICKFNLVKLDSLTPDLVWPI